MVKMSKLTKRIAAMALSACMVFGSSGMSTIALADEIGNGTIDQVQNEDVQDDVLDDEIVTDDVTEDGAEDEIEVETDASEEEAEDESESEKEFEDENEKESEEENVDASEDDETEDDEDEAFEEQEEEIGVPMMFMMARNTMEPVVATVNGDGYTSLQKAIEAVNAMDNSMVPEVIILEDINAIEEKIAIKHSVKLTGDDSSDEKISLEFVCARGITVEEANITVTLEGLDISVPKVSGDTPRAVQVSSGGQNVTLNIDDCRIASATHYALNIVPKATGLKVNITDSEIVGYAAINCGSPSCEIEAFNSTFKGINNSKGETNDFGTIALYGDGESRVTFTDCELSAVENNSAPESIVYWSKSPDDGLSAKGNVITFEGSDTDITSSNGGFVIADSGVDGSKNTIEIKGGTYDFDPTEYVANGYVAIENLDDTFTVWRTSKVTLNYDSLETLVGQHPELYVTVNNERIDNSLIRSWTTSKSEVAEVTDGVVDAKAEGDAVITATTTTGYELSCSIKVITEQVEMKEVAGEVQSTVDTDAIAAEAAEAAQVPENAPDTLAPEEVTDAVAGSVMDAVDTCIEDLTTNTEANKPAEGLASALNAAMANQINALGLSENHTAKVVINPTISDQEVSTTTTYDENTNTIVVTTKIEKIVFEVEPELTIVNPDGTDNQSVAYDNSMLSRGSRVSFRLPVPDGTTERYVKLEHNEAGNTIGTYYLPIQEANGHKFVLVTVSRFSQFAMTFTNTLPSSGGSGGGGGSTTKKVEKKVANEWVQDAKGWWYRYEDGTWPANQWLEIEWNGKKDWYFFNEEGYMITGWFKDGNTWYYLHPTADGTQGHMYTGWHQLEWNGKLNWYYFNPVSDGTKGSMLANTTTPDGYKVDASGAWIQ